MPKPNTDRFLSPANNHVVRRQVMAEREPHEAGARQRRRPCRRLPAGALDGAYLATHHAGPCTPSSARSPRPPQRTHEEQRQQEGQGGSRDHVDVAHDRPPAEQQRQSALHQHRQYEQRLERRLLHLGVAEIHAASRRRRVRRPGQPRQPHGQHAGQPPSPQPSPPRHP